LSIRLTATTRPAARLSITNSTIRGAASITVIDVARRVGSQRTFL
jgi:hypothetical protein